jgi:hypothetical protein
MTKSTEPHNPFYLLLLLASLLFVVTVLAYLFLPILAEKATLAGDPPPPSEFREKLEKDGWRWLLYEVGAMIVLGLASMGLDRFRRLQKERASATISQANDTQQTEM